MKTVEIDKDTFFVRSIGNKTLYIHINESDERYLKYVMRKGLKGACAFRKIMADKFVKLFGPKDCEVVRGLDIVNSGEINLL